jgi:hypothetical protein
MTRSSASRPSFLRDWLIWAPGFLAFPIGGFAGTAVAGRVDDPVAALLGGAIAGPVIGAGQALVSSRDPTPAGLLHFILPGRADASADRAPTASAATS